MYHDCEADELILYDQTWTNEPDKRYLCGMWKICEFMRAKICVPRALGKRIAPEGESQRDDIAAEFSSIYDSAFSAEHKPEYLFNNARTLAERSPRFLRQHLFITSNYFHALMLIHCDEQVARHGAMVAARTALSAYFLLCDFFPDEATVWFHFQQRAYLQTIVINQWLKAQPPIVRVSGGREYHDAEADVRRMYGILKDRLEKKEERRMGEEKQQDEEGVERKDELFAHENKPVAWETAEVARTWVKNLEEGGDTLWGCV